MAQPHRIPEVQQEANRRLRQAVRQISLDPALRVKIRTSLPAPQPAFPFGRQIQLAAVIGLLTFIASSQSPRKLKGRDVEEQLNRVGRPFRLALGDHLECALRRSRVVRSQPSDVGLPNLLPGYRLVESHLCTYESHVLTHLVYEQKGEIASVILMSGEPETKGITQAASSEFTVTAGVTHGNRVFLVSSHNRLQDRHRFERLLPQLEAGIFVSVISFYALGSTITLPLL